jgi:site-specific DNA-methyltransferase (adenine-specific)
MTCGIARKANPAYGSFANTVVTPIETTLGRWPANVVTDGSDEVVSMFPNSKSSQRTGKRTGKRTGILGEFPGQDDVIMGHDDSGSAARFFYSAKASKHDRANSKHPTVKPVSLMRWLCKLVTPPDGLILDPFAGSGTTGAAAHLEGFRAILCERGAEYQIDIENRLRELCGEDPSWLSIETPPWLKTQEAAE